MSTVPIYSDEQGIVSTGEYEEPVSSRNEPAFFHHSLSVSPTDILNPQSVGNLNFELETGDIDDAMYYNDLNEVKCTHLICNERISNVGQEWSAGRQGNRPIALGMQHVTLKHA